MAAPDLELIAATGPAKTMLEPGADVMATLTQFVYTILHDFYTPESHGVQRTVIAAMVDPAIGKTYYEQCPLRAYPHVMACHFYGLLESEVHQAGLFNVVTRLSDS